MPIKSTTDVANFLACDLRVGTILEAREAEGLRNRAWVMRIDFGSEVGVKTSVGQFRNYTKEQLVGKQVIGVVNLPPRRMGPYVSETLTLGVGISADANDGHKALGVDGIAANGDEVC
jgi:tRNA-binding protein